MSRTLLTTPIPVFYTVGIALPLSLACGMHITLWGGHSMSIQVVCDTKHFVRPEGAIPEVIYSVYEA